MPACDGQTDGRTDGQTDVKHIAITCFSIADARKNVSPTNFIINQDIIYDFRAELHRTGSRSDFFISMNSHHNYCCIDEVGIEVSK